MTSSVYGTFSLKELSGKTLDSGKVKILDLPIMTHRGTFVVQGKDYAVFNQMRLRPGVYTTQSEDAGTVTSRFNLGKGLGFKLTLNPITSIFYVTFDSSKANPGGQSKIPLYSLLKVFGVSDEAIKAQWGDKLFEANTAKMSVPEDIHKVVQLCVYQKARTGNDMEDLRNYFDGTLLSGETTKVTLGSSFNKVTGTSLLEASKKIVRVYNGKEQDDDMDSLLFKEILAVEDHLMLRISKGAKVSNGPIYKLRRKLDTQVKVADIVPTNFLSKLVETFFTTSSLSSPQTEINPIEILETHAKITSMGEGGIKSEQGIPMSARNLHPSHFGFIDPVRTTESLRVGVDVRMTDNTSVKNRNIYSKFLDSNGKEVLVRPLDLVDKYIGFPGQDGKAEVRVLYNGEMIEVPRNKVNYFMRNAKDMFTYTTNITPFMSSVQGNRVTMASRFITQAVPLVHREAPLVQVKNPEGPGSIEEKYGKENFLPKSPVDGTVTEVTDDHIIINGKTDVELYHNFPYNYKTMETMYPKVKVGDKIKKGQILAESNFTDKETLALGTNLRVGYVPYKGYTHEDSIVISKSAAKKLTSMHLYIKEIDIGPDITIDKNTYAMMFPSKISVEQMNKLDDRGIAKEGIILERGDFAITAMGKKQVRESDDILQKMHSSLSNPYRDLSVMWDHDRPGKVTDVIITSKLVKVVLTTEDETQQGDKLCYSPDTEVLTKRGWIKFPELTMDDSICCLDPETDLIRYDKPTLVKNWDHNDKMYHLETQMLDFMVTTNHKMYIKKRYSNNYELEEASKIFGKRVQYKKNGIWNAPDFTTFTLPAVSNKFKERSLQKNIPMDLWLEFLGYYLSEGCCAYGNGDYKVDLSQSLRVHPELHERMFKLFELMGYSPVKTDERVFVRNKQLYTYLHKLGKSFTKYIPKEFLSLSSRQSKILLDSLIDGDGHRGKTNLHYFSISKQLCDNVQVLALNCGYSGTVIQRVGERIDVIKGIPYKCHPSLACHIIRTKNSPMVNHGHVHEQHAQVEEYLDYTGKVYCCTVPTHVLYVRRNGKAAWCGNTGHFGNKGTVGLILPDNEMPFTKDGKPLEVMLNPAGVISRVNPGQLWEAMAGKIALKNGKPYYAESFHNGDNSKLILKQMKDVGISPTEELIDPKTKKSLGHILVGNPYILKLHKQTEGNFSARSTKGYDANLQPAKGGEEGSKGLGLLDFYALLSHNARNVLFESAAYKSQENEPFWDAIKLGHPIPPANEPFVFDKFKGLLGAAGVNVKQKSVNGEKGYTVSPMTDKDTLSRSAGEIQNSLMLKGNVDDLVPETGGMFDKELTGGLTGRNWNHINLAEPIPHPLFEKQIKVLMNGKDPKTMTGQQIEAELSKINVPERIKELKELLLTAKGSTRDKVIKELKYLSSMKAMNMKPQDYVLHTFPVIPPAFRPVYPSPSGGSPMVSDINQLYKDLINTNSALKELKGFPEEHKASLRKDLYQATGAVIGITDPVNMKSQKQELKGALKYVDGNTAKDGFFHRKVMYRTQDMTGRGTILPNPNLHVDECEIPIDMAYQLYKPFMIRKMVGMGYKPTQAAKEVLNKTDLAKQILEEQMADRPVLLNRAPTLHKYNIMALKPKAVEGKSIFIPPLIIKGYGADSITVA